MDHCIYEPIWLSYLITDISLILATNKSNFDDKDADDTETKYSN